MGFRVKGLGFGVYKGLGCRIQSLEFRVVKGLGLGFPSNPPRIPMTPFGGPKHYGEPSASRGLPLDPFEW